MQQKVQRKGMSSMEFHESLAVAAERAIRIFSLTAFSVAISIAGTVWAQSDASISGSVTDPSGGAVSGATVTVRNLETGAERLLLTDEAGRFNASLLLVGTYEGNVAEIGFSNQFR